jgi:hypothetical protein
MAVATAISVRNAGRRQFQALFSKLWTIKGTLDAGSLVDAAGESDTTTLTFAAVSGDNIALGDHVLSWAASVDVSGMTIVPYVSAAGVLTVRIQNESTATVDLASATWTFLVGRPDPQLFS